MNCCCDVDCTNHDLKLFTLCSDQTHTNLIKPESILFDSSLFYVVVDNVPSDYFYPEREVSITIFVHYIYINNTYFSIPNMFYIILHYCSQLNLNHKSLRRYEIEMCLIGIMTKRTVDFFDP